MFRNCSPDPEVSSGTPCSATDFIRKMSYEMGCSRTVLWFWRIIPKHPVPQLILYEKSVVERGVPELFSRSRGQFQNTPFRNSFYTKSQLRNGVFRNCFPDPELSIFYLIIPNHLYKDKTVIS